ncbi:MAG TPA: SIS domain-containing protein [Jiangellaceae bacterium]
MNPQSWLPGHVDELCRTLTVFRQSDELIEALGRRLAWVLDSGGRLLAVGNGGSAAEAQHLTAELVGRFDGEHRPMSAICLSAETSSLTAILNDYGPDEVFARQVEAHGRPGDVLVAISTSGRSRNVLRAAERARAVGLDVWALTGAVPNPLAALADFTVPVMARSTAVVQEIHLVAVHALCAAVDGHLPAGSVLLEEASA